MGKERKCGARKGERLLGRESGERHMKELRKGENEMRGREREKETKKVKRKNYKERRQNNREKNIAETREQKKIIKKARGGAEYKEYENTHNLKDVKCLLLIFSHVSARKQTKGARVG